MLSYEIITIVALSAIIAVLALWMVRIEYRMRVLLGGKKAHTMEDIIADIHKRTGMSEELHSMTKRELDEMDKRLKKSIRGIKILRFNAFTEGGHQSFAVALLNEDGDGAIISTLHARERVGVFGKPIKNYVSEYELSAEEKHVLEEARSER